jgi:acyl-CoA-associated DUF35 OB-fold domain-containing protein
MPGVLLAERCLVHRQRPGDAVFLRDSYVINYRPAPGFEDATPYAIAVVELEEGPRMMTNILGLSPTPEALVLDMPLQVRFERRGDISLPVFGPAEAGRAGEAPAKDRAR